MDVFELYNDKNLKLYLFLIIIIIIFNMNFIRAFQLAQRSVILFSCEILSCRLLFLLSEQSRYGTRVPFFSGRFRLFKKKSVFSDFHSEKRRYSMSTKYKLGKKPRSSIH